MGWRNENRVVSPEVRAEAIRMRREDGLSGDQIATSLGLPRSTVTNWFSQMGLTQRKMSLVAQGVAAQAAAPERISIDSLLDEYLQTTPGSPEALRLSSMFKDAGPSLDGEDDDGDEP